jgi:putative DNA primase/helicase
MELKHKLLPDLLATQFAERELIVDPWLEAGGLSMIYAPTGHGKTLVLLNIALCIASGQTFLDQVIRSGPKRVLYVDGEMPIALMQERLRKLLAGQRWSPKVQENFAMLSHEFLVKERGIPPLGAPDDAKGRRLIDAHMAQFDVLILDNLSSLMGYGVENDAESWVAMNEWLLTLRRRRAAVIVVHHGTKKDSRGQFKQRGTSRRMDQLDSVIQLEMTGTEPLTIHWLYEKHRSFLPKPPEGFEIEGIFEHDKEGREISALLRLASDEEVRREAEEYMELQALRAQGKTFSQIEAETGISRSTAWRKSQRSKPGASALRAE